jgi:hypothetical protein
MPPALRVELDKCGGSGDFSGLAMVLDWLGTSFGRCRRGKMHSTGASDGYRVPADSMVRKETMHRVSHKSATPEIG